MLVRTRKVTVMEMSDDDGEGSQSDPKHTFTVQKTHLQFQTHIYTFKTHIYTFKTHIYSFKHTFTVSNTPSQFWKTT